MPLLALAFAFIVWQSISLLLAVPAFAGESLLARQTNPNPPPRRDLYTCYQVFNTDAGWNYSIQDYYSC